MTKTLSVFMVSLALALGSATGTEAAVILDQDYTGGSSTFGNLSGGSFGRAQTFTVGIAGLLDSVEVVLIGLPGQTAEPTLLRILATSGGIPIGGAGGSTVLATSSVFSVAGDVFRFDLSGVGLTAAVGDVLAIEVLGTALWVGAFHAGYPGGSEMIFHTMFGVNSWTASGSDKYFRTYMEVADVPEPGLLLLLAGGMAAGARRRWTMLRG